MESLGFSKASESIGLPLSFKFRIIIKKILREITKYKIWFFFYVNNWVFSVVDYLHSYFSLDFIMVLVPSNLCMLCLGAFPWGFFMSMDADVVRVLCRFPPAKLPQIYEHIRNQFRFRFRLRLWINVCGMMLRVE